MRRITGPCYEPRRDDQGAPVTGMPSKGDYYLLPPGHVVLARTDSITATVPLLQPVTQPVYAAEPEDLGTFSTCLREQATHWEHKDGGFHPVGDYAHRTIEGSCNFRRWVRFAECEAPQPTLLEKACRELLEAVLDTRGNAQNLQAALLSNLAQYDAAVRQAYQEEVAAVATENDQADQETPVFVAAYKSCGQENATHWQQTDGTIRPYERSMEKGLLEQSELFRRWLRLSSTS